MYNSVGERLKMLRISNSDTQQDVAKYLNVMPQTISKYEKNINEPDNNTLIKYAIRYNTSTDFILGLVDDTFSYNDILEKDSNINTINLKNMDAKDKELILTLYNRLMH